MRKLPHSLTDFLSCRLMLHVSCLVVLVFFSYKVSAQSIQFSSAGTTNNFDSLSDAFGAKNNKFRLSTSSYRNKSTDSLSEKFGAYRGKYNKAINKSRGYQSKYGEQVDQFNKYKSKYNNNLKGVLNEYGSKPTIDSYKSQAKVPGKYEKYQTAAIKAASLADQLLGGKYKLDSSTIFNSKIMQKYMDSIKRTLPAKPTVPYNEVSKQQLLDQVNKQFQTRSRDLKDSIQLDDQLDREREWVDLNYTKLKAADGNDLKPMATSLVTKQVMGKVDSLNMVDLKASRMKMKQVQKSSNETITKFRQVESFWKKSYLEAVLGLSTNSTGTAQISPAWAYHILPSWSVGVGPNILINRQSSNFKVEIGARVLTKYEMLHRSIYIQMEDRITPNAITKEESLFTQHSLMAGGGYVIPFLSPITFNISTMYKFYSNQAALNEGSAWVFRIGISTRKRQQ